MIFCWDVFFDFAEYISILLNIFRFCYRLSTYNKTDEHEVVYYQECPDEDTMTMVEQVVFQRLKDYREQANRERFILPENKTIELFIDIIKNQLYF